MTPPLSATARSSGTIRLAGGALLVVWVLLASGGFTADRAAQVALIALLVVGFAALRAPGFARGLLQQVLAPSSRAFVIGCAAASALTSYLLGSGPMRSRPMSIDAVVYLFQARALSHGHFGALLPEPRHLFGARFLFEGADGRLHGVFPPGFPLFLVPFVWLGAPMLAGPVVAAMLTGAQWLLGRAIEGPNDEGDGKDGLATRLAMLIAVPSFARAVETSDLLSHAFVAALGATAVALALLVREKVTAPRLLAIGGLLGWLTAARFLDGLVFGFAVFVLLAHAALTRRLRVWQLLLPALAFVPFAFWVLWSNRVSSGSWWIPTQSTYFARSDWPTHCHRLGFGWDVGCAVEHGDERRSFGADGYGPGDALRIVRERAGVIGGDLFGFAPLLLAGMAAAAVFGLAIDALLAAFIVAFTLAYGLFYYGNANIFGARHLFPIAPFAWLLVARAVTLPRERLAHAASVALAASMLAGFYPRWMFGMGAVHRAQGSRLDLREIIDRGIGPGLVVTADDFAWFAAFDPEADGPSRILVRFDGSGLKDLRRAHPGWPVHSIVEGGQVQTQQMAPVPPGLLVELERTWPSFIRPLGIDGVGTKVINAKNCCKVEASGDRMLFAFVAKQGDGFDLPFTVPVAGRYSLRVDGMVAPDYGTWAIRVDQHELPVFEGYASEIALRKGTPSEPIELSSGRHTLTFRCLGKRPESTNMLGAFDTLVGTP